MFTACEMMLWIAGRVSVARWSLVLFLTRIVLSQTSASRLRLKMSVVQSTNLSSFPHLVAASLESILLTKARSTTGNIIIKLIKVIPGPPLFDNEVAGWLSNKYTVQRDDDSSRAFVTMLSKIQLSVDPTTLGRYLVY
jgi:hypothetical protein